MPNFEVNQLIRPKIAMIIDLLFLMFGVWGFYLGFNRGIIQTVFTILTYTVGFVASIKFTPPMTKFLESSFGYEDNPLMFIMGFFICFVFVLLTIRFLVRTLEGVLESINLNIINRLLGGVLLAGILILIYSFLLRFVNNSKALSSYTKDESVTYPLLSKYPDQVWGLFGTLKPVFRDFWDQSVEFLDNIKELGQDSLEQTQTDPIITDK